VASGGLNHANSTFAQHPSPSNQANRQRAFLIGPLEALPVPSAILLKNVSST
jgi:hypothetical protein